MKTFVISDTHFGHKNIIEYCNRPFKFPDGTPDVKEMDRQLIENWNAEVGDDDVVLFAGDFMFYKKDTGIFNSLKGKKILASRGNHDPKATLDLGWEAIHTRYEFTHNGKYVVIDHYPLESWNHKYHGSIHLFGHVHDTPTKSEPNRYCICVEHIGYKPVLLDWFTAPDQNLVTIQ